MQVKTQLEVRIDGVAQSLREVWPNGNGVIPGWKELPEKTGEPGEGAFSFALPGIQAQANVVLHVRLIGPPDHFPLDDEAWLVVGVVRKAQVLIVGEDNPFLDSFFAQAAKQGVATVERLSPADLADEEKYRRPALEGKWDLVIFDRCTQRRRVIFPLPMRSSLTHCHHRGSARACPRSRALVCEAGRDIL